MNKTSSALVLVSTLLLLLSMFPPIIIAPAWATPETPVFAVEPSSVIIPEPDQTFQINITVTNSPPVVLWALNLSWNPAVLNLTDPYRDIAEGDFLRRIGTTIFLCKPINYSAGSIREMACGLLTGASSGSGVLCTITFTAIGVGHSDIDICWGVLVDETLYEYYPTLIDGKVDVGPTGPRTWIVDDDGPANFHTIQEAIDAANAGDTIFVRAGVYYERLLVSSNLSLVGEDRDTTIIDGNGTYYSVLYLSHGMTSCNIKGFTIRNGGYGIRIRTTYAVSPRFAGHTIKDNHIVDNLYGAIFLRASANNTISNNIIANNTLFGIHLWSSANNTIVNNTIVNNGHGIDFYGNSNDNILRNNNMTNNKYNFGLIVRGETRDLYGYGIFNDVDSSNTVNGKPIYYWVNQSDAQVPSDAGYVWLNNCNNITIADCNLSNNLQGILLLCTNNTRILNNNITSNVHGIFVRIFSDNNTIVGNTLIDNINGIYLSDFSRFTTMRNNNISGGYMNFGLYPDMWRVTVTQGPSYLINDIDTSNTVDGKPIIYWVNQHNRRVPANAGYVMLINSTNILIEGLTLSNNVQNIFLLSSNDTVIANNSISNSIYGIDVWEYRWFDRNTSTLYSFYSFNTTIRENTLVDNGVGIRIYSDNSIISDNKLYRNPLGIYASATSNSIISGNVVVASDLNMTYPGIDLYVFYYPEWLWEYSRELFGTVGPPLVGGIIVGGAYNVVYGNTVMDSLYGISMVDHIQNYFGRQNIIFHNNLIDNMYQAMEFFGNYWDNGYPSGGNYWSDYSGTDSYSGPYQNITGSDGIGDTPYYIRGIRGDNLDHYPLMKPYTLAAPKTQIGVKTGDWIKYEYTITGAPPETLLPTWLKVEFLNVEGTTATVCTTTHMSDGTELTETTTGDLLYGSLSGVAIPANCTTGDFIYISGYGYVMIIGETTRIYAGMSRVVVYSSFSVYGFPLTYYWDKQTGIMVEGSTTALGITVTLRATETNMWSTAVTATVDINPHALNLWSRGEWITAYIELPEGYYINDINVSSIMLDDTIPAEPTPVAIEDYDNDKIPELMVKFNRAKTIEYILANVDTKEGFLTITGKLNDGTPFQGSCTIRIIHIDLYERLLTRMLRYEKYMQSL